jgi:hypothetical protein
VGLDVEVVFFRYDDQPSASIVSDLARTIAGIPNVNSSAFVVLGMGGVDAVARVAFTPAGDDVTTGGSKALDGGHDAPRKPDGGVLSPGGPLTRGLSFLGPPGGFQIIDARE